MKKQEPVYLKVDSKNKISLSKLSKNLSNMYRAYSKGKKIILEPIENEDWIFLPENKESLNKVKKGLKQKANIDLGSFKIQNR